ncbi:MAG: NUDIX domain-containing protein [Candidatus Aenigmarchaeota archaeon]|nr:NUDIX domain-containing protein [Candidatus Aenigmarchaeota archaeon]
MNWKKFSRGVFLVNVLGIIYNKNTGKILIGRRQNDPHIKKLSWCFPGGRPSYGKDLEFYLKKEIKTKTGLSVNVKEAVFAKTYPENRKFLSIYYYCEPVGKKEKPGEKFVELKWIKPDAAKKYFTTSLHPKLWKYLRELK